MNVDPARPLLHLAAVTLRFRRDVRFHFHHGMVAYAALMDRLDNPPEFPAATALYAPESGSVHYRAGEPYRLGLACRFDARPGVRHWAEALSTAPRTRYGRTDGAPLGDTFDVSTVDDLVRGAPLGAPAVLRAGRLGEVSASARAADMLTVRLLSPVTILRPPVMEKTHVFDGHHVDPAVWLERAARRVCTWFPDWPVPERMPEGLRLGTNALVRADLRYPKKTILGSSGRFVMHADEPFGPWADLLVLAGILGVGQSTNFGQGRYVLEEVGAVEGWPPTRARSLLARVAAPAVLDDAARAMREGGPAPGVDDVDRDTFLDRLDWESGRIAAAFEDGRVAADALLGLLVRRPDGRYRPLAIPTMRDRYAQRAVITGLQPAVDVLLDESSFAYRPNLSRRSAQDAIRRAHDDGFRWIFEGDIARFFDEVHWDLLEQRLVAWFGVDPLVDQLLAWVKAPVLFDGRELPRDRGLPQGAVVSPMLANLYLDCFDDALSERGMRLVRYADDFVVVCRTREDAAAAHAAVEEELARLRLSLSPQKSAVRSFEQGFRFLGSVFCRTLVFDAPKRRDRDGPEVIREFAALAADTGALAALADETGWMRALTEQGPGEPEERRWRPPVPSTGAERRPAYVVSGKARVMGRKKGVWVEVEGAAPQLVAWGSLSQLVIVGGHYVSPSVYSYAMVNHVPVALHRRDGSPIGLVLPEGVRTPSPRAVRQWAFVADAQRSLGVGRALVEAKIHNVRLLLRRQSGDHEDLIARLDGFARLAGCAESAERLRAVEGQAAHAWFSRWDELVGPAFSWSGRSGRGAGDPINALLNLLYSMLFRRTWLAALTAGLDPYAGVLHAGNGRHAALASDLMEPFRFLVDRVVLDLVHRRMVTPGDFQRTEKGPFPLRIGEAAVKLALAHWEATLHREVKWNETKTSFDRHLQGQARSLAAVIDGERATIEAFRMKW